ncbi:MAG: DUF3574 domain-containing protein [Bradyrhizobiaceae bacterium]|nr:DUF3574 domain-containing protein [Bradyrhizobiaceae bacterium]
MILSAVLTMLLAGCSHISPDVRTNGMMERLFLGRQYGEGRLVSDSAWQVFVAEVVVPTLHGGLTVYHADGQWKPEVGDVIKEPTFVVEWIHQQSDDVVRPIIQRIIDQYKHRFVQQEVLWISMPVRINKGEPSSD